MTTSKIKKRPEKRPVRVIHRVNQKLVTTECKSVRDSNVSGFIELLGVHESNLQEILGDEHELPELESLVLPKIVVVAIVYPRAEGGERVVLLHPQSDGEELSE